MQGPPVLLLVVVLERREREMNEMGVSVTRTDRCAKD